MRTKNYFTIIFIFIIIFMTPQISQALTGFEYLASFTNDYWKLEDTANALPRNILVNNNSVTFNNGLILNGANFTNTSGKYLRVTNLTAYQRNENRTVNLWIKPTNFSNRAGGDGIFYMLNANEQFAINVSATKIEFDRTRPCVAGVFGVATYSLPTTSWTMLTISYDNVSNRVYGYINGSLVVNFSSTAVGSCGAGEPFNLGTLGNSTGNWFNGLIDEVSIFKRVLNSSEINFLYASGSPTHINQYPFTNIEIPLLLNQSPSDITISNAINGINITYSFNITNLNTTSPRINWTIKNSTGSTIYSYLNGTRLPSYQILTYSNTSGINYRFFLDDNIYPATYNYNHSLMQSTTHYNYTLINALQMLKIEFFNVTPKKYDIIEIDLSMTSANSFSDVYYCNSSYTSGLPMNTGNCAFIGSYNFSNVYNHCHNLSCHNFLSMGILNGEFNNVTITPTSYIIISGAGLGNVNVGYINGSIRTNVSMYSSNRGVSWTNQNFTIDAHMHLYDDNDYIEYYAYAYNTSDYLHSSVASSDAFNITNLPPSGVIVSINDNDVNYDNTMLVTRTNSIPFNTNISRYDFSVYDVNLSLYQVINSSTNSTNVTFELNNFSSGYYYVGVRVYDNNGLSSLSFSEQFKVASLFIEPCNETITLNSTGVPVNFNFTRNIFNDSVEIYGRIGLLEYLLTSTEGENIFIGTATTTYTSLFTRETIDNNISCSLTFCVNTWTQITTPCIDNLRLINYSYSCSIPYDYPANYGLYEDCVSPANTDKDLWLIIIMLVIWIIGTILALRYSPLIMIMVFIDAMGLAYYTNEYFTNPIIAVGILVITAFMFFASLIMRKN